MATGGSKALKELEKEQKTRTTRMVRDSLDAALLDIATLYRDIMLVQSGHIDSLINVEMAQEINAIASVLPTHKTIQRLDAIMKARKNLGYNAAPLLTIEALMCELV
jgi:DNA polymerase-3 subunit delta'